MSRLRCRFGFHVWAHLPTGSRLCNYCGILKRGFKTVDFDEVRFVGLVGEEDGLSCGQARAIDPETKRQLDAISARYPADWIKVRWPDGPVSPMATDAAERNVARDFQAKVSNSTQRSESDAQDNENTPGC